MQSYTPTELSVLNGLALNFGVSDCYFSSVPNQTNCNRAFAASGNSLGINNKKELEAYVNNRNTSYIRPYLSQPKDRQFNQKTIWNVLTDNNLGSTSDWIQYCSGGNWLENLLGLENFSYTRDLMERLQPQKFDKHFDKIDVFLKKAKEGTLPTFSFLEPKYGLMIPLGDKDYGINGTDYHPPCNLVANEKFVKKYMMP